MDVDYHPFLVKGETIPWQELSHDHVVSDIKFAIEIAQKNIDQIASLPLNEVTFDNTIKALHDADNDLSTAHSLMSHLVSTCDSDELREEYNKVLPLLSEFSSNILLNDDLWARIKAFSETEAAKELRGIEKKLLTDTVDSFKDSGIDLPRAKREELKKINLELSKKCHKFEENVLDSRNAWEKYVTIDELDGLPQMIIDILESDAKSHGHDGFRLSLDPSTLGKCMQKLDNENIREELYRASKTIGRGGKFDNADLVSDILKLRDAKANILGFKTYADLCLKHRMAKNGRSAMKFIEKLHDRTLKYFKRENKELVDFYRQSTGSKERLMKPWNTPYWSEKLFISTYKFDEEELRPYFKLENVLAGLFKVAGKLYGIKFVEQPTCFGQTCATSPETTPVWHKDVKYYKVFEESGDYIGGIYFDIHPRKSKRGGAWMTDLLDGYTDEHGDWHHPVAAICSNLTPSTESNPSLLTHREVETLFHEFGHALHHLFGRVKYRSMNGSNVAWDFVELPSQIMENFCWDRATLDMFARHYITNEPIPQELFDKMTKSRNYAAGCSMMGQLSYAKLDLELHQNYKFYAKGDIESKLRKTLKTYRTKFSEDVPTITLSFHHVFGGGYAAGYYSYKWAEVLDADAFNKFKENGVLSREIGQQFRDQILSRGDSEEADVLFRNFMGRDPDIEALFIRSGLVD